MTPLILCVAIAAGAMSGSRVGCQLATIEEFFNRVNEGAATVEDMRRLTTFDHDYLIEQQFQRCRIAPHEMEHILCPRSGQSKKCEILPDAIPDEGWLSREQERIVIRRSMDDSTTTKSEIAAFLKKRWPTFFGTRMLRTSISGPWRDKRFPTGVYYNVRTKDGAVYVGFNRDSCQIEGIGLPDGTVPMAELDCLWRQEASRSK